MSASRIAAITLGLMAVGALCGGAIGIMITAATSLAERHVVRLEDAGAIVVLGGFFGGAIGAVLAPLLAWVLLREVPIGRSIVETGAGALLGAAVAFFAAPGYMIAAAILGFVAAGLRLRIATPFGRPRSIPPHAGAE